jgi:hypothetical protein
MDWPLAARQVVSQSQPGRARGARGSPGRVCKDLVRVVKQKYRGEARCVAPAQ